MKILFVFGGGKHDEEIVRLAESFLSRVVRYVDATVELVNSKRKDEDTIRRDESEMILAKLKSGDRVVLFDERGLPMSSDAFSKILTQELERGGKRLVVVVGGAYGVTEELRKRAEHVVSFSKMIFPHQLARVMALEQVYRGLSIAKGSKYHHAGM